MSRTSLTLASASAAPADRLATLPDGEPEFTLGWEAILWAERGLIQPNGPRAKQPFRFTRDQMRFLLWWYAMDPATGEWLFRHGVRRLSKGSGKSPFAAVWALIEFCGPVRLARKTSKAPGGCIGRPVQMPWVQLAATAESQTKNTMRMVRAFAPKGSAIVREYGLDPGKTVYYKEPEGTLEVITSSFTAAEGAEATAVVADETEHWNPRNGGTDLASTLADNLAKSGERMLETANAWVPGEGTVAEDSWDAWVAQEEGQLKDDAGLMLYDARIAPPSTDMADYASLETALRWVYGDCEWKRHPVTGEVDVAPQIARIWSPSARPAESKRKYFNWPSAAEDAWTTQPEFAALARPDVEVDEGEQVVLFFDGSKSRDATAIVACRLSDGHVFVPTQADGAPTIWEPDPSHDTDDVVVASEVDAAVEHIFERFDPVAFFADVAEWESFTKVEWPRRFDDRLKVHAQSSGKDPQPIAWDMRSRVMEFTRSAELVLSEIEDGLFTHDGNPVLSRHVVNMRRRPNRYGVSVGKESRSSAKKIDAGVCLIGARMVRRVVLGSGWESKKASPMVVMR
jgi:hypothetical protein